MHTVTMIKSKMQLHETGNLIHDLRNNGGSSDIYDNYQQLQYA